MMKHDGVGTLRFPNPSHFNGTKNVLQSMEEKGMDKRKKKSSIGHS